MFNLEDQKYIKLLDLNAQIYTESEFKCKHIHLDSSSDEKVFMVAFRTIPEDSTGVAHILEHTALCGSKKYPVRDPFFMMIRRSLNTFMNAFTSSDWTAYPFATLNDKDFNNLLSVYLDSSFFPNLDELDFCQEGHRLEYSDGSDIDNELEIKGVVYNEMKGAMSSVSSQLWHGLSKHLYSSSTYKHNSGGNPEDIIDLTHGYLVDFHKKHYHPSNATFFTFGDIDPSEIQEYIKKNVLESFEPSNQSIKVENEKRITSPKTVTEFYNPMPNDEENHHVVLSWLLGESHDPIELLESYLVSNILLDNSASPLRKALENTELGRSLSPLTGLETDHKELVFAAGLEGVESGKQMEVEELILDCLKDIVKNGISEELIASSLHQLEIRQREITGSGMPYGLQIMLSCLPACVHNDDPLRVLDLDSSFSVIKNNLKSNKYIENLIKKKIIENTHRVNYSLVPDPNFNNKNEEKIKNKVLQKSKNLSQEDKQQIIDLASNLKERQEAIDNPEILPKVTKEDIPSSRTYANPSIVKNKNINNYYYETGTNGITYHSMIFPCNNLSDEEFKVASLFGSTLTEIGIGKMNYEEVQKIQSAITGGISSNFVLLPNAKENKHNLGLKISSKCLEKNEEQMQKLMLQTLSEAKFENKDRIKDMLNFISSGNERSIIQNGHMLAMSNAGAQVNNIAATNDMAAGINFITNTSNLSKNIDKQDNLSDYLDLFASIKSKIATTPIRTFTASSLNQSQTGIGYKFKDSVEPFDSQNYFDIQDRSIGWITGAQVCYCAEAFPTVDSFHDDAPILSVLGAVLRNGYLHSAIREKGGAYGSGATQDSHNKVFKFFSYRDPRCSETFNDFAKSREWALKNITAEHLEEGVLGVISSIDKPLSPYGEAMNDFSNTLDNKDKDKRLHFRSRVKDCTVNELVNVAGKYLFNESKKSLIAGESYIDEIKKLNFEIKNI
ncbi:MAG: Zn-dependent peptidase [Gammaproteobacteria bacterium TMED226]|nr:MAG: Zn-dependent peptidase [Gammaproteobacteria bacterium TMED226]